MINRRKCLFLGIKIGAMSFCNKLIADGVTPGLEKRAFGLVSNGINITALAFSLYTPYSVETWDKSVTKENLSELKKMGFDHVRLALDPTSALASGSTDFGAWWAVAQHAINCVLNADLQVIVDLHVALDSAQPSFRADQVEADFSEGKVWKIFGQLVEFIGLQVLAYDAKRLAVEIYNETTQPIGGVWPQMVQALWATFRARNKTTFVLVGGSNYSSVDGLQDLRASAFDENTGFVIHDYDPGILTHQGIGHYKTVSRLHYPPIFSEMSEIMASANDSVKGELRNYFGTSEFDKSADNDGFLEMRYDKVKEWCEKNKVSSNRVFQTESGIHNDEGDKGADRLSRLGFIQSVSRLAGSLGISRTQYAWDSAYWALPSARVIDADFRAALGLTIVEKYERESLELFSRLKSTLPDSMKVLINATIKMLKDAGLWNKLEALYVLATSNIDDACMNWINNSHNLIMRGAPDFIPNKGFKGVGSEENKNYLETNIVLGKNTLIQSANGHIGIVQFSPMSTGDEVLIGDQDYSSGVGIGRDSTLAGITNAQGLLYWNRKFPDGVGHLICSRINADGLLVSFDGNAMYMPNKAKALVTTEYNTIRMLASKRQSGGIALAHIGANLSEGEHRDLYSIAKFYLSGLKR